MKFFIDTANVTEIKEAASFGMADGVTTNPTLISKEKGNPVEILKAICDLVDGPISAEVVSLDAAGIVKEGRELAKIHKNIYVKIPITKEGLIAVRQLKAEGIPTNVTLVFNMSQALMAAKAGANLVSFFVGRLDDISAVGMEGVRETLAVYDLYNIATEVVVASIRNPLHVVESALAGAHIATIPYKVLEQLIRHPLTDIGIERFLEDWEKVKARK